MTSHRRLRAVSWIAILAIVGSVLAPVASRAMATWSGNASPWDEICTSLGLKKVAARAADRSSEQPADPSGMGAKGECPNCLPSASPSVLPSRPASVPPAVEPDTSRFLFFFISAPHPITVPDPIRPRAPPQVS